MNVFDEAAKKLLELSKAGADVWVKRMNDSPKDIRVCEGQATEDTQTRTCALCVALNHTVFKNSNKPEYFHPHCKCEMKEVELREVTLDFPIEKITGYLFINEGKSKLMKSMGYAMEDAQEIYDEISENARKQYLSGNYILGKLNPNGQRITINMELKGKQEKADKIYEFKTGWMVYPNGELHNNTPFSGFVN